MIDTGINGEYLICRNEAYVRKPVLYVPRIIILAQGKKNVNRGRNSCTYDSEHYLVLAVPLPVECETVAKEKEPMFGLVIDIDPQIVGEILFEMDSEPIKHNGQKNGIFQAKLTGNLIDSSIRLLKALNTKNETRISGPVYLKEIIFTVLNGKNGDMLKELAYHNRGLCQIARVINTIQANYADPVRIEALAQDAGMSMSAFHASFKPVTNRSLLQYLKKISGCRRPRS